MNRRQLRNAVDQVVEVFEYSERPWRQLADFFVAPHVGWLRWKPGEDSHGGTYEPPEPFGFAPPLWRAFHVIRWRDRELWRYMRHPDPDTWRLFFGSRREPRRWAAWLSDRLYARWTP